MQIVDKREPEAKKPSVLSEVPMGAYFVGRVGEGPSNELYVRTFNRIVLLKDPQRQWESERCPVYDYQCVEVTITIERNL